MALGQGPELRGKLPRVAEQFCKNGGNIGLSRGLHRTRWKHLERTSGVMSQLSRRGQVPESAPCAGRTESVCEGPHPGQC